MFWSRAEHGLTLVHIIGGSSPVDLFMCTELVSGSILHDVFFPGFGWYLDGACGPVVRLLGCHARARRSVPGHCREVPYHVALP